MKELYQLDIRGHLNEYDQTGKFDIGRPYETKSKRNTFVENCMTLFSKVTLVKNENGLYSAKQTIDAITDISIEDSNTRDISGTKYLTITRNMIIDYIWIFRNLTPSKIGSTKYPALVPVFLYAHKLYNNIEYDQWDWNEVEIRVLTSLFLLTAMVNASKVPSLNELGINKKELREQLLPNVPYTAWPLKQLSFEHDGYFYDKELLIMELQLWKANVNTRDEEKFILDAYNPSNIPAPLDVAIPKYDRLGCRNLY